MPPIGGKNLFCSCYGYKLKGMTHKSKMASDEPSIDLTAFSVARLTDPDDSLTYWLSRPVAERLQAVERLRRTFYGAGASEGFQRVIEVIKFERR